MKIELQVLGGLAALNLPSGGLRSSPLVIDTGALSERAAQELRQLLKAAEKAAIPAGRPRPDAMSHQITVTEGDQSRTLVAPDGSIPPEVAALITWLRQHAQRASSRPR